MTTSHSSRAIVQVKSGRRAEDSSDRLLRFGLDSGASRVSNSRRAPAKIVVTLCLVAMALGGCGHGTDSDGVAKPPTVPAKPPIDTVLVSDFLRYKLDGDMEMDRAGTDCYGGLCVTTDGERILFNLPRHFHFAGLHDSLKARKDTIEDRDGIMIGDVSKGDKALPDIAGVATDRTTTGWGGWGEYVGFDTLYLDFVRKNRPQRIVWASVGGYRSQGNPVGDALTWKGGAAAIDRAEITENRNLIGNAELKLSFTAPPDLTLVSLSITELEDVVTGTTYDNIGWKNIPLREGGFENRKVRGQFFGPNHEEVAGTFERDTITGAFAARRVE